MSSDSLPKQVREFPYHKKVTKKSREDDEDDYNDAKQTRNRKKKSMFKNKNESKNTEKCHLS